MVTEAKHQWFQNALPASAVPAAMLVHAGKKNKIPKRS